MSTATPASSTPDGVSPITTNQPPAEPLTANPTDRIVMEYLRARGYKEAEQALLTSLETTSGDNGKQAEASASTISADELAKQLAVFVQTPSRLGENALKDSGSVLKELQAMGNPPSIQNLISNIGPVGAEDVISVEPTDKEEGFKELEAWVDGSLDMYRPEFRPLLYPIFCHFYLELIQSGYKNAALTFFSTFSPSVPPEHSATLHHLSTLLLPFHVQSDPTAQNLLNEKYVVKMSRTAFGLLIGWLTEGFGGEAPASGGGFSGEKGKRGRTAIMRVVNNHLKVDVETLSTPISSNSWEESTGLMAVTVPQNSSNGTILNAKTFNSSQGQLKLGPAPISDELRAEVDRHLRESAVGNPDAQQDVYFRPVPPAGLVSPSLADLPPYPPTYKSVDVKREVEKVRDARKRIRLEPTPNAKSRTLPSICAYTLHDVGDGVPCCTFSQDTSLMAAGFSESYIRLWSLKGEKLKGYRSDFQSTSIRDAGSLRKVREKGGSSTRKLIGHSGPVYSVAFDPFSGSAGPPKNLLSASADGTVRLWSMDTMTNIVAYRGHQNPVWDVQWGLLGIYFATASRDRTARLWSTDRTSTLRVYAGHNSDVNCVQFNPNSLYIATGSADTSAKLWDVQRGACVRSFLGHQGGVSTLAFSPDGRYLATGGEDLTINLWDLGSGTRIKKMTGHRAAIYSLAFSAESSMLVSGGADWTVRCWDVSSAGGLPGKPRENGTLANGFGSSDAANETSGGREEENIETTDLLATFPTKRTPIINVQFTPRNLCLIAGPYLTPDHR